MTTWFHTTILATSFVATVAVGIAGAAIYARTDGTAAPKADRLPVATETFAEYETTETRTDGMSILTRLPVGGIATN